MIQQNAPAGKMLRIKLNDGTYQFARQIFRPDNSPEWEDVSETVYNEYLSQIESNSD